MFDCVDATIPDARKAELARTVVSAHDADSALFVESSQSADVALRIFEKDGTESDCCGNGAFLVAASKALPRGVIEMKGGTLSVRHESDRLSLTLGIKELLAESCSMHGIPFTRVNCGEPHLVHVGHPGIEFDLNTFGANVQSQYPAGVNVSTVIPEGHASYIIRTYERGVNGVTKSCGTGALAAHCALAFLGLIKSNSMVEFKSTGGCHWVARNNSHLLLEVLKKDCRAWSFQFS